MVVVFERKIVSMGDVQMLFPMEPKEFWQKLKAIVEQVVIEHGNSSPIINGADQTGPRPLLKVKEVCAPGRAEIRREHYSVP